MTDVIRQTSRNAAWRAWSGDLGDLGRIAEIFSRACKQRAEAITRIHREHAAYTKWCSCERDADDSVALAVLHEGRDTVGGPVDSVLGIIDRRTVRGLDFVLGTPMGSDLKLAFNTDVYGCAVKLEMKSVDQDWVRQTYSALCDEIGKGVPRWQFMRRDVNVVLLGWVAPLVAGAAFLPAAMAHHILFLPMAIVVLLLMIGIPFGASWAFPAFEITYEGVSSTGSRRLSYLIGLLSSIPIGVVVNLVA